MSTSTLTSSLLEDAHASAEAAAARSRVAIRPLVELAELGELIELFDRVWSNSGPPQIGIEHMRALAHAGNYVVGAFDLETGRLLGGTAAFFAAPPGHVLHSDITGVDASARDRKLGFAIKVHQRAWCLDLGISKVVWTFDPLIRRNAYFNLVKLRAGIARYYVDFYGGMSDGINAGQPSDRLLVTWRLDDPVVADACALRPLELPHVTGEPLLSAEGPPPEHPVHHALGPRARSALVSVPADIEGMRRTAPDTAREWRQAVRDSLGAELAAGSKIIGFRSETGYVLERGTS